MVDRDMQTVEDWDVDRIYTWLASHHITIPYHIMNEYVSLSSSNCTLVNHA